VGILLKWRVPDSDVTYDKTYIYRSDDGGATYSNIANQSCSDNTYFDVDGTSSSWYKIRFYYSSGIKWSDYSDAMQGGTFTGYCTPDNVRTIANLTTSDISDSDLWDIIQFAQTSFNKEINAKIREEVVKYIGGDERQNKIDGSNKTYYVQKSYDWYVGDMNNDGEVDDDDVEVWDYDPVNDTKTLMGVESVDYRLGKIVLDSAPATGHTVRITYVYSPVDEDTPDEAVKQATAFLAAALAFTKTETTDYDKLQLGKLMVAKTPKGFKSYYEIYRNYIHLIKTRLLKRVEDKGKYVTVFP